MAALAKHQRADQGDSDSRPRNIEGYTEGGDHSGLARIGFTADDRVQRANVFTVGESDKQCPCNDAMIVPTAMGLMYPLGC